MKKGEDHASPNDSRTARLAMVTCGPQLEVALQADSIRVVSLIRLGGVAPRSTLVLAAIDLLVEDAGLSADAIGEVVVSRGPGSFTGIRAGLATAMGLVAAVGAKTLAYDSLLMLAARCDSAGRVWGAQPGRRGEVYARQFEISEDGPPQPLREIEIVTVEDAPDIGPWIAAEALDLGGLERAVPSRSSAEALLRLAELEVASDAAEPLYVEGPPIHQASKRR